jgi:Ca-activated chloride channel family protein
MIPSKQRIVRVQYLPGGSASATQVERSYFSGTLLGIPSGLNTWIALGALLFALSLWLLLTRLRFINRWNSANLEVLGGASTKMFPLGPDKTIIGSSATDDVTLVGSPNTRPHHATVVFDPTKHRYTVLSDDGIRVNNKKTLKRDLESGDVIDLGGTLVVFDEPELDDSSKR